MPTKSLPETFFHLECLSDARLLVPWKVTDEDWKARDQLIASVSDWREAQGMWGPGGEEEQGHSPVVTTLAGDGCCVPLPPVSRVPMPPHWVAWAVQWCPQRQHLSASLTSAGSCKASVKHGVPVAWPPTAQRGAKRVQDFISPMGTEQGARLSGPLCKP